MAHAFESGFEAIKNWVEATVTSQVELERMHEKTGLSAEALSGLSVAAKLAGADLESVKKAVQKVALIQLDSATGSKAAAREMHLFGIQAKDTADQAFDKVSRFFHDMPDGITKTGLAVKVFGNRIGTDLLPMFDKATDGLRGMEEQAAKFGLKLSQSDLNQAEEFEHTIKAMGLVFEGVAVGVTRDVIPAINDFVKELNDPGIAEGFGSIAKGAIEAFSTVISWTAQAAGGIRALAENAAAEAAGANRGDIVRQMDEIDRMQKRMGLLRAGGGGNRLEAWMQGPDPLYQNTGQANFGNYDPNQEMAFLTQKLQSARANLKADQANVGQGSKPVAIDAAATKAMAEATRIQNEALARSAQFLKESAEAHAGHARKVRDDTASVLLAPAPDNLNPAIR